jgi:LPXTG-motif cell wall-anchored protein
MKKIAVLLVVILGLFGLVFANAPATNAAPDAYTGLSGRIIDSKTLEPWSYGAEVWVIQTTGTNVGLKGTTTVAADGTWSITFNSTDDLNLCGSLGGCSAGNNFATYVVRVSFSCNLETANTNSRSAGPPPSSTDPNCPADTDLNSTGPALTGLPQDFERSVTDAFQNIVYDVGDWETGRGPTAVSLQSFNTEGGANAMLPAVVGLLLLAGASFVIIRRRQQA